MISEWGKYSREGDREMVRERERGGRYLKKKRWKENEEERDRDRDIQIETNIETWGER